MKKFRLNRRAVIRGAGTIAIGLPWLECMEQGTAHATPAPTTAQRFIAVYQPGGTVLNRWRPTGTETAPVLSPILAPLEHVKDKIITFDGVNMPSAIGEQHQAGIIAWLTGTEQGTAGQFSKGPSIDQVIAQTASQGKRIPSMEIAIRWATGKSHGLLHAINAANFEANAPYTPIPPRLDPVEIWNYLFGMLDPEEPDAQAAYIARKRSILDLVDRRYNGLVQRLGVADRERVEQHLTKIREIEMGLIVTEPPDARCVPPTLIDTSDYNPKSGLNSSDNGSIRDASTDAMIPAVGKLMTDMMVMALACDMTAVGTLQWSDTEAKHTFPWLNLMDHHHFYQHDGGFRAAECEQICRWYSEQHLYLIQQLAAIDMGGHSLLDETVVFFGSEIQDPPAHNKVNMPFMLAGNGGGLRTGRHLSYAPTVSHNRLLVSILNLFGNPATTFGTARHASGGPLTNLT